MLSRGCGAMMQKRPFVQRTSALGVAHGGMRSRRVAKPCRRFYAASGAVVMSFATCIFDGDGGVWSPECQGRWGRTCVGACPVLGGSRDTMRGPNERGQLGAGRESLECAVRFLDANTATPADTV